MLIAQITDTHVTHPGHRLAGRVDSSERLVQAVRTILKLDVTPDCVLATGDLTDRGEAREYAEFRRVLAPLTMPVYVIPGNHDRREALRAAFSDCPWMPKSPGTPLCYHVRLRALDLIALDTLVEGQDHGRLGPEQVDWLRAHLDDTAGRPTIVMLHHPPMESGIAAMDAMKLEDSEPFGELIARHRRIERVLCGHLHRSMHALWRGCVVSVPPATVEQVHLALAPDAPLAAIGEPPGLQLHHWTPARGMVTHNVAIGDHPGPFRYGC